MLNCWEAEPSNRPSFAQLKTDINQLQENNNSNFVQFPGPEALFEAEPEPYNTASPLMTPSRVASPVPQQQAPLGDDTPSTQDMAAVQRNFLDVETRRRRHLSAPIMEGAEWNEGLEPSENGGLRQRSHSNAYVQTPRRDSNLQVRRSFEWMLEPPEIIIPPVITIQPDNSDDEAN